jgi:hypothetical protein
LKSESTAKFEAKGMRKIKLVKYFDDAVKVCEEYADKVDAIRNIALRYFGLFHPDGDPDRRTG